MLFGSPDPFVLRTGPRAWPPPPLADVRCPVCLGQTACSPRLEYCLWCDAASPGLARMARARTAGRVTDAVSHDQAVAQAKRKLGRRHGKARLSERERREIWLGTRRAFDGIEGLTNLAAVGRAWLREINQLPDFSVDLDRRGNEVGRESAA